MRRRFQVLLSVLGLTLFGATSQAAAYDRYDADHWERDRTRIYGGLWLGFGGDIEVDGLGDVGDLGKTIGGQAGVDVLVLRYLSLGGEVRVGGFDVGNFDDRSRLIDLDFKPRLRLPLGRSPVELYATVPVGLTIPRLADVDGRGVDENIGWNVGVGGGANLWVTHNFGLNVEPIWLVHHFGTDGTDGEGNVKIKQFSIMLNALFAI
jgi:hypothetical protein